MIHMLSNMMDVLTYCHSQAQPEEQREMGRGSNSENNNLFTETETSVYELVSCLIQLKGKHQLSELSYSLVSRSSSTSAAEVHSADRCDRTAEHNQQLFLNM